MDIRVFPTTFFGHVDVIGSKSLSHRYVIAACLSEQVSEIHKVMDSEDLKATITILQSLGATINLPFIKGPLNKVPLHSLDASASGSTLRFLIPLAMQLGHPITFIGKERLPFRSLLPYQETFAQLGVHFTPLQEKVWLPLTVKGPLLPGTYALDASVSSQFITGLLWVLPFLKKNSTIIFSSPIASKPYMEMTIGVLKQYGVIIHSQKDRLLIPGNQTVKPIKHTIESDYSHSVFFLAGALLKGSLSLSTFPKVSLQGDQQVLKYLVKMGAVIDHQEDTLHVNAQTLKGCDLDFLDYPDLAPMFLALSGFVQGTTRFFNLHRLADKESSRFIVMKDIFDRLGVFYQGDDQCFTVQGKDDFTALSPLQTYQDHRIAMTLLMLAGKAKAPYVIQGVECLQKSYPNFLDVYQTIGGRFNIIGGQ